MSTLKRTFESLLKNLNPAIYDYSVAPDPKKPSDLGDFARLWDLSESNKRILILWPKTAPDETVSPVNTTPAVSPIELAVCMASKVANSPEKWPQIAIIDLNPKANRSVPLYRFYCSLRPDRLPWLRVFQADDLSSASPVSADCLEKILFPDMPSLVEGSPGCDETLRGHMIATFHELKHRMRLNVSDGGSEAEFERHGISNLIGPMMLLPDDQLTDPPDLRFVEAIEVAVQSVSQSSEQGQQPEIGQAPSVHRKALRNILETICSLSSRPAHAHLPPPFQFDAAKLKARRIRFILTDDQWQQGWIPWLRSRIQVINGASEFIASSDPHLLAQAAVNAYHAKSGIDARFRMKILPDTDAEHDVEIPLVDLRLFSSFAAQAAFLEKRFTPTGGDQSNDSVSVLEMCRHFEGERHDRIFAWPAFSAEELNGVEAWIANPKSDGNDNFTAIGLLARLLSQLDLAVPFILFSSTGQTSLLRQFHSHKNIIGTFEKPRTFGQSDNDIACSTCLKLNEALSLSFAWHYACRALPPRQTFFSAGLDPDIKHIELYLDESLTPEEMRYRVGGFAVGYRDEPDAAALNQKMESSNLVWVGPNPLPKRGGEDDRFPTTESLWDHITGTLKDLLGQRPIIPFVLFRPEARGISSDMLDILNPEGIDNIHYALVKAALESFVFEILPQLAYQTQLTLSVFVARRLRCVNYPDEAQAKEAETKLATQWGINDAFVEVDRRGNGYNCFYQSIDTDSVYPLVAEILATRQDCPIRLGKALGKSLTPNRGTAILGKEDRHIAYLSDYIAHLAKFGANQPNFGYVNGWLESPDCVSPVRFADSYDDDFLWCVDASRRLDARDVVGALLNSTLFGKTDRPMSRIVTGKLNEMLSEVCGEDWALFVDLLAEQTTLDARRMATPAHRWNPAFWPAPRWKHPHRQLVPYGREVDATVLSGDATGIRVEFEIDGRVCRGRCMPGDFEGTNPSSGSTVKIVRVVRDGKARGGQKDKLYYVLILSVEMQNVPPDQSRSGLAVEQDVAKCPEASPEANCLSNVAATSTDELDALDPNEVLISGFPQSIVDQDVRKLVGSFVFTRSIKRHRVAGDSVSYIISLLTVDSANRLVKILDGRVHYECKLNVVAGF